MRPGSIILGFFTSFQGASDQMPRIPRTQPPQTQPPCRPLPQPVSMFLTKKDIPSRLFRADLDFKSVPPPSAVGFYASAISFRFPKTTVELYKQVLNHTHQERGEKNVRTSRFISLWSSRRAVEDEVVRFRSKEKGDCPELKRAGGPGDGWFEEGHSKPWRVWTVDGSKLRRRVLRVRDLLGWNKDYEGHDGEQFLVWKHVDAEVVYAAEEGSYDNIRNLGVEEIKRMELETRKESEVEKEGSSDDDAEGGARIGKIDVVAGQGHQYAAAYMIERARGKTMGSSSTVQSSKQGFMAIRRSRPSQLPHQRVSAPGSARDRQDRGENQRRPKGEMVGKKLLHTIREEAGWDGDNEQDLVLRLPSDGMQNGKKNIEPDGT